MVQPAPEVPAVDEVEAPYVSPVRGGGHAGHTLAFFLAAQGAPAVSMLLALAFIAGGTGATWWLWTVVGLVALPALAAFGLFVFAGEQHME